MSGQQATAPIPADPEKLQAEVERLRRRLAEAGIDDEGGAAPPRERRQRWRAVLSAVLVTLAVLLAPVSAVAVWASQEINNPDVYTARMSAVIDDQSVRDAISRRASDAVLARVDLDAVAQEAAQLIGENRNLNERQSAAVGFLADSAASAATNLITEQIGSLVNSAEFESIWLAASATAQESLVAWLSGDDDRALQIQGDSLVVDISEVLTEVKQRLTDRGVGLADRIPTDTEATFVLVQSDAIGSIQTGYSLLSTLGVWLPVLVVALAVAGILLARRRRNALLGAGIGLLIVASLALMAMAVVSATYKRALPDEVDPAAVGAVFDAMLTPLVGLLWAGFAIAVIIIVAASLMGRGRFATDTRGRLAAAGGSARGVLAGWGADLSGIRSWAVPAATGLRIAAVAVAVVVLMLIPLKTVSAVLWTALGLVFALVVIEILAGGEREPAPAPGGSAAAGDGPESAAVGSGPAAGGGSVPAADKAEQS
jgi:hypothetical protein